MDAADFETRQFEFARRLTALIHEYADFTGPHADPITDELCDHDLGADDCPCVVKPGLLATEWAVVIGWQDMDGGEVWSTGRYAPGMRRSHVYGLLAMHIDDV